MERKCIDCGALLARDNTGERCSPCQKKQLEQRATHNKELIDAEEFAFTLGLKNAESVKRKARKGELPPRVPQVRKCQWYKKDVYVWIEQKQKEEIQARDEVKEQAERAGKKDFRRIASGLASNLRRLSNDNHIKGLYEIPGEIVFGTEAYLGTTEQLQIDVITLVKIPRKPANRLLRMLPEKEFPELKGITDWSKLPYNRIHEAFLVRLETYF